MLFQQDPAGLNDVLGFAVKQADGFDIGLHAFHAQLQHGFWRIGDRIEQGSGFIDAHIGRLCREQHRDQQFKRGGKIQLRRRVRVLVPQTGQDRNATEVNQNIDKFLDEARKDLPKGVELTQMMSSNDFLFASIHEVVKTLIEAIILVILVVYVFLQDFRSTLIPLVGIVVSLVGTFAFMAIAGFSINLLTLFALVLVIGTVVDDAIIVVEAVQARFDVGYRSSYMASIDAMKGISNAVITSSLVFMAVFIPVSFMGGTSGTFYTQFGLTMAVAVGISAINALTLSPALCALLLKPYINEDGTQKNNFAARFRKAFNSAFDMMVDKYKTIVLFFIKRRWLTWSLLACSVVLLVLLMNNTKTSLVPDEDQGVIFVNVSTAAGSSLTTTDKVMERIEKRLIEIPQLKHVQKVAGYGLLAGQVCRSSLVSSFTSSVLYRYGFLSISPARIL